MSSQQMKTGNELVHVILVSVVMRMQDAVAFARRGWNFVPILVTQDPSHAIVGREVLTPEDELTCLEFDRDKTDGIRRRLMHEWVPGRKIIRGIA